MQKFTNISGKDRKKYETVMEKLDEFFFIRNNVISERASLTALFDESMEQFITTCEILQIWQIERRNDSR